MKQLACLFSTIKSTVISYVTIFEIIWRQQELYQQISKFEQQIETSEQVNKQLNETIGNLRRTAIKILAANNALFFVSETY